MRERIDILEQIKTQSMVMESALEAEDFEVFEGALEEREALVSELEKLGPASNPSAEEQTLFKEIQKLHESCTEKLIAFQKKTEQQLASTTASRNRTQKASDVQTRYQGSVETGSSFDIKK